MPHLLYSCHSTGCAFITQTYICSLAQREAHVLMECRSSPHQTLSWLQQQHSASVTPSLSNSAWYKQCCTFISARLPDTAAGWLCAHTMRTRCLLGSYP